MTKSDWRYVRLLSIQTQEDLSKEDTTELDGLYLPGFYTKYVTARQVASALRWQALMLNGEWDQEQVETFKHFAMQRLKLAPADQEEWAEIKRYLSLRKLCVREG